MGSLIEARRRIMSQPRKIRVTWNQMLPPIAPANWGAYNTKHTTMIVDGVTLVATWITNSGGYNHALRPAQGDQYITHINDVFYLSHDINPSIGELRWSAEIGGGNIPTPIVCNANIWTRVSWIANGIKNGSNYPPLIMDLRNKPSAVDVTGMSVKARAPIYINLTTMYGAGNEPSLAEFERQCALNGIDLTQYQPQDSGTVRSWYI